MTRYETKWLLSDNKPKGLLVSHETSHSNQKHGLSNAQIKDFHSGDNRQNGLSCDHKMISDIEIRKIICLRN